MKKWHGKYQSPFAREASPKNGKRFVAVDWTEQGEVILQSNDYADVDYAVMEYLDDTMGDVNVKIYDRMNPKDREVLRRNNI